MKTLPAYEQDGNLEIRRVGRTRNSFLRYGLWKTLQVAAEFDQIHTTTYAGAIPASIAGQVKGVPVLITIHEVFGRLRSKFKNRGWLYRLFERLIFQFPYTCYTCVSHYTKAQVHYYYKIARDKLHVIYNGVNDTVWTPKQIDPQIVKSFKAIHQLNGKFIGLYYGHSGASKGIDQFIRAIPTILDELPSFHAVLNIIPTSRDHKILELINTLGLTKHILLLHGLQRKQLVNIVGAADFVIVPSVSEGFGLVAAEVSQLQKPIVATKNGALPEVVSGKVVFLKGLAPNQIVEGVKQVKEKNWETIPAKQFDRDAAIDAYEQLYRHHCQ